jgi:hypothetical protein
VHEVRTPVACHITQSRSLSGFADLTDESPNSET